MMPADGIQDLFRFLPVPTAELHSDGRMSTFHFVVHRLADVVQETTATSQFTIKFELISNDLAQEGNLDRMPKYVLPETRSEMEFSHGLDDLRMQDADDYNKSKIGLEKTIQELEQHLEKMMATYQYFTL